MLTAFDVGLTNKRLVLDTRQDKRERAQHSASEPHSSSAQTSDVKTGVLGVHTVAFGVFLAVYLALCVSDVLDSEPRHGTKVHMCILAGVPVCRVYQPVRTVRLRYLVMGVLLHTLALVATGVRGRNAPDTHCRRHYGCLGRVCGLLRGRAEHAVGKSLLVLCHYEHIPREPGLHIGLPVHSDSSAVYTAAARGGVCRTVHLSAHYLFTRGASRHALVIQSNAVIMTRHAHIAKKIQFILHHGCQICANLRDALSC